MVSFRDYLVALAPLILGLSIGWWTSGNLGIITDVSNSRYLLSSLIQSIAAILGIVFSVMVLATQFIGDKYSLNLKKITLDSKYFYLVLCVFTSLFAIDMIMLFLLPSEITLEYQTAMIAVAFTHFSFLYLLLRFVQNTFHRLSPEGLTKTFRLKYRGDKFAKEVKESGTHPSNQMLSFILDSIQDMDRSAAKKGLTSLKIVCTTSLDHRIPRHYFHSTYEPVLCKHLPMIVLEAKKKRVEDVAEYALETMEEIATYDPSANKGNQGKLLVCGLNGFYEVVESATQLNYHELSSDAGKKMTEPLKHTEELTSNQAKRLFSEFGHKAELAIIQSRHKFERENLALEFTRELSKSISDRIGNSEVLIDDVDFNSDNYPDISIAKASKRANSAKVITSGLDASRKVQRQVLSYLSRGEFEPNNITYIAESFEQLCVDAAGNSSGLAKIFVRDYIALATLSLEATDEINEDFWIRSLSNINSEAGGGYMVEEVLLEMSDEPEIPEAWENVFGNITSVDSYRNSIESLKKKFEQKDIG